MIKVTRAAATIFAICGVAAGFAPKAVAADHLKFQYLFSEGNHGHILTGVADGVLAADGNHFTVKRFKRLKIDHVESIVAGDSIVLQSWDYASGYGGGYNGNGTPVITLDGSYLDLYFYEYHIHVRHAVDVTQMAVGDEYAMARGASVFSHFYHHPNRIADDFDTGVWTAEIINGD